MLRSQFEVMKERNDFRWGLEWNMNTSQSKSNSKSPKEESVGSAKV